MRPGPEVLASFGASADPVSLPGGRGTAWRAGEVVLKPAGDPRVARWTAELYRDLDPLGRPAARRNPGFRVPRPLRTVAGDRAAGDWAAGDWVAGDPVTEIVLDPFASPWRPRGLQTGAEVGAEAPGPAAPALPYDFRAEIAAVERRWLEAALQVHGGHQGRAATALGLGYDQLRHLLRKHGISARSGGDDA